MGLYRAGFDVTGFDIKHQPNYPFNFVKQNALDVDLTEFDFVWASPPCQKYSFASAKHRNLGKEYPDCLEDVQDKLRASGKPYIIENVKEAPLLDPVRLTGPMFGLGVIKERIFESNLLLMAPPKPTLRRSVRNKKAYVTTAGHGGDGIARKEVWAASMGIWWMDKQEMAEAIPPAYAEFLGRQVWEHLKRAI